MAQNLRRVVLMRSGVRVAQHKSAVKPQKHARDDQCWRDAIGLPD